MIDFRQYPKHDNLNHLGAIRKNIDNIKSNIIARQGKASAQEIENLLNNTMYTQKNQANMDNSALYENYREQAEKAVNRYMEKVFGAKNGIQLDQDAEGFIGNVKESTLYMGTKGKQLASKIRKNLQNVQNATKVATMSEKDAQKLIEEANQLLQDLASAEKITKHGYVTAKTTGTDFVTRYNKLMNSAYTSGYYAKLGTAGEAFTAAVLALAKGYAGKELDKAIEQAVVGSGTSSASISGIGLDEDYLAAKNVLLKGWRWEEGSLKCKTESQDKIDVIFNANTPKAAYISVKNYKYGATDRLGLSDETHLASLFSSAAVTEPFTRAYMRFLGWEPGHWRSGKFYSAQEVIDATKNTILILAISGLGFQKQPVNFLTVNNRADGYWRCYTLEDLTNKLLDRKGAKGAKISGLPEETSAQGIYHEDFLSEFLHLKISVSVQNLRSLMGR